MRVRDLFVIGTLACAANSAFGVSYAEGVDGDLSGNRLAPTSLGVLGIGSHSLTGFTTAGDLDYWTINVPAGAQVAAINLTSFVSADDIAFIAIQAGTTFTESNGAPNVANILGYTHFGTGLGAAPPGTDMLDNMGVGPGAIGFTPPLPAGDYTFWTQQANAIGVDYVFEIVITSNVPQADYDEDIDGDLSGDRLAPTDLGALGVGTYTLRGTTEFGDLDYWRISIPAGAQLTQLVVTDYIGEDATAFNGVQAGTTFTEDPATANVANILGYVHFGPGPGNVGTDILDDMGLGFGAIGFTPPLPADDYTFWTQQAGADPCTYTFDLVVTAVPPPACTGDINGDGSTNSSDFNILAGNFGTAVTPGTNGDLTGDGVVNSTDFNVLAGDFGCPG